MPADPWINDDGKLDIEEVQEDLSFAADIFGVVQRQKANKQNAEIAANQRQIAQNQRSLIDIEKQKLELLREEQNEKKRVAALPKCPDCGGTLSADLVSRCRHCQIELEWIIGDPYRRDMARKIREKSIDSLLFAGRSAKRSNKIREKQKLLRKHTSELTKLMKEYSSDGTLAKLKSKAKDGVQELEHKFSEVLKQEDQNTKKKTKLREQRRQEEEQRKKKEQQRLDETRALRNSDVAKYGLRAVRKWESGQSFPWVNNACDVVVGIYTIWLIGRAIFWLTAFSMPIWYLRLPSAVHYCLWLWPIPTILTLRSLPRFDPIDSNLSEAERREFVINRIKNRSQKSSEDAAEKPKQVAKKWLRCSKCSKNFYIIEPYLREIADCPHCGAKLRLPKKAESPASDAS